MDSTDPRCFASYNLRFNPGLLQRTGRGPADHTDGFTIKCACSPLFDKGFDGRCTGEKDGIKTGQFFMANRVVVINDGIINGRTGLPQGVSELRACLVRTDA